MVTFVKNAVKGLHVRWYASDGLLFDVSNLAGFSDFLKKVFQ